MLPLLSAILVASLLGSTHCVGMCGAFLAFAVGAPSSGPNARSEEGLARHLRSKLALNTAYNLGRLATYVVLGAIAGALGVAVDLGGSLVGVQRIAACAAGAIMAGFGVVAVLRHLGVRIPRLPLPAFLLRLSKAAHERAFDLSPLARAAAVGLLTTLLPCGWLYAFVVTSAGIASPLWGSAAMLAFWVGTLPVMGALGLGLQTLAGPLRKHVPLATSVLLVIVGLTTLFGRMTAPALAADPIRAAQSPLESIQSIGSTEETCPLCRHKDK